MFSVTDNSSTSPQRLRSSGTRKMPWPMASRGVRMATVPAVEAQFRRRPARSMPKMARASSVRPAPTSPAMPRISPARRERSTRAPGCAAVRKPATSSTGVAGRAAWAGCRAISGRGRSSGGSWRRARSRSRASSPTTAPSRSTTTRSAQCSTSFRRCEMKMIATPSALSSAITCSSRVGLGGGEARGRLVHDDDARVERQRLGDLDELALGERQVGDRRVGLEVDAKPPQQRRHVAPRSPCGRRASAARRRRLAPDEHIGRRRRDCRRGSAPDARRRCPPRWRRRP